MHDNETPFVPLTDEDTEFVRARIAALRNWYSAFDLHPINACVFDGDTNDICVLDYIFYELGADSWGWDHGITHAVAWGNVVVQQFGFQWCKFVSDTSPRHFAVRNPEVPCVIFPWVRLFELVENPGHKHSAHAHLLLSMISDVDQGFVVPDGWHPVLDAISRKRTDFPSNVVDMLSRMYDEDPNWIHHLDMYPYDWNENTDWNWVRTVIQAWSSRP